MYQNAVTFYLKVTNKCSRQRHHSITILHNKNPSTFPKKYWQRIHDILLFSSTPPFFFLLKQTNKKGNPRNKHSYSILFCFNFLFFLLADGSIIFFHIFPSFSIGLWLLFLLLGFRKKDDFPNILAFVHALHGFSHLRRDRGAEQMFTLGSKVSASVI